MAAVALCECAPYMRLAKVCEVFWYEDCRVWFVVGEGLCKFLNGKNVNLHRTSF